jgi:hypothetical protein
MSFKDNSTALAQRLNSLQKQISTDGKGQSYLTINHYNALHLRDRAFFLAFPFLLLAGGATVTVDAAIPSSSAIFPFVAAIKRSSQLPINGANVVSSNAFNDASAFFKMYYYDCV